MKNIPKILSLFIFLPLVIGVENTGRDSSETNLKIAGGLGSYAYVTRGCEGEVLSKEKIPFKDVGFSMDHKFKAPVKIGLRSGYISDEGTYYYHDINKVESRKNFYLNPDIALEWKNFGFGVGPFIAQKTLRGKEESDWGKTPPSWHIRIGPKTTFFSINMLENVPLYSGGGYLNLGVGVMPSRNFSLWLGLGTTGPYDNVGFIAKTDFRLKGNLHLDLAGRLGSSEGISENAMSMGLNYKIMGRK